MAGLYLDRVFNKVEGLFQAFTAFCDLIPDEAAAQALVLSTRLALGPVICKSCNTPNQPKEARDRHFRCKKCKKLVWITAGTTFDGVVKLRPYLAANYLKERGIKLNPHQFHELLEIPYNTAVSIFKSTTLMLVRYFIDHSDTSQVAPSSVFIRAIFRRSRETPAGCHPREEERRARELFEEQRSAGKENRRSEGKLVNPQTVSGLDNAETELLDCISAEPIQFDSLIEQLGWPAGQLSGQLTILELKGFVLRLPGENYVRKDWQSQSLEESDCKKSVKPRVNAIIKHICRHHQGIARKYLQFYVADFLFDEHLDSWKEGTLLRMFLEGEKIRYKDVLDYVTELQVSVSVRVSQTMSCAPA